MKKKMKGIRNMKQLREEKKRLHRREKELEWQISRGWRQLNDSFRPENIFKKRHNRQQDDYNDYSMNGNSILERTLIYGATLLARKLARKAEENLDKVFGK
jgi:hypothetical protein